MKASTFAAILGMTILSLSAQAKRIKTISSPEGISNNAICAIHQDALGHLYIGTMDGLNIWDGNELKTFEAKDGKNYFSGNQIRYIIPGPDCHLYLRTNYGTAKLDMITREVEFYDQLAFATSIAVTKDGNIFSISKSKALAYLSTATLEQTTYPDMHFGEAETIKQMFLLDDGRLFVATTKDTYFLTFDNSGSSPALQQVERTGIGCLFAAARSEGSHLIVSADGRVLRMDAASGTSEELSRIESALLKNDRITGAIADDSGCLLSFMQHGVMRHTYGEPGLEETDIHCGVFSMIQDKFQPIVWMGTDCNGLIEWSDKTTEITSIVFDRLPYSIDMPIRSIYVDQEGSLWLGTKGDGLYRIRHFSVGNTFDSHNTDRFATDNSALGNNAVFFIRESRENLLWTGGEGNGLFAYSYKTRRIERVKGSERFVKVHDLLETDGHTLWVATDEEGCYRCKYRTVNGVPELVETQELAFTKPFGPRPSVFSIAMQNDTTLWFSSRGNGVLAYNVYTGQSRPVQFPGELGLAINETFYAAAQAGDMLFASGNGMVVYNPVTDSIFRPHYVPQKAIHSILPDGNGNIWITTNSGILSLDPQFRYRTSFNRFSGIEVLEYSDGACYRDSRSGKLFFGGINGFTVIDEDSASKETSSGYTPDIHITNFIQNNEYSHISLKMKDGKLRIPYSKSIFAIEFSLVDNLNYPDYRFSYTIDGYNDEWTTNESNTIYLPFLNPGDYTLKIKYLNQATQFESGEYCLDIYIIPPAYKSWWAKLIYILLALFAIYQLIRYIRGQYNSMKEKYEAEILKIKKETTSAITDELAVQFTFILGLCQQIKATARSNANVASIVNLVEYNIARINRTLQILSDYKGLSDSGPGEVSLIHVSQIAEELLDIMSFNSKRNDVTLLHEIEKGIIIPLNKEAFFTLFNTLLYKCLATASGKKEVCLALKRGEKGGIVLNVTVTMSEAQYEEVLLEKSILQSKLAQDMNGHMSYNYNKEAGILVLDMDIPQQNMEEQTLPYEDSSISEMEFPVQLKTDLHMEKICLVSANKEVSSFLKYFLSEKYNVVVYSTVEEALSDIPNQMPVAIMYDLTSMISTFSFFTEKMKENKRAGYIPVIALTSSLQVKEKEECMALGADACISFPFNMDYLHAALEKMLNRRESIAEYYNSPISTYVMTEGRILHKDDKEFMNNLFKIIDDNLSNPELSAAMIAEKLDMGTRVLYRKLAEITDKSLHQIIKESRMEMATKLLYSSKLTIDEIMYRVGYDNRSTFYRNFKEAKGMAPKEYREGIKENTLKTLGATLS
jgi:AraC-like DNA-binding protein/ligand-binding sensor domain-containing protein